MRIIFYNAYTRTVIHTLPLAEIHKYAAHSHAAIQIPTHSTANICIHSNTMYTMHHYILYTLHITGLTYSSTHNKHSNMHLHTKTLQTLSILSKQAM